METFGAKSSDRFGLKAAVGNVRCRADRGLKREGLDKLTAAVRKAGA